MSELGTDMRQLPLCLIVIFVGLASAPRLFAEDAPLSAEHVEFFEKSIRPILVEKCEDCHSARAEKTKGLLRVDSRAGLLKGGETGPAVVPGQPDTSLLIKAVRYTDDDLRMPPKEKLSAQQIADLERWVKMGAPDPRKEEPLLKSASRQIDFVEARKSWVYRPVKVPPVPAVKHEAWIKSEIDRFILSQLEAEKVTPAQPADKRTLLRRASIDLTGLPPSVEEVNEFLNDSAPNAFAKVIDRMLESPRYGERWGRHWLDFVRYADSRDSRGIGGEADITEAWRYRDWIVQAFNRDLPYDQFIINQIAGDLLPAATPGKLNADGIVATGLLAIGEWGTGDADKDKMMTDIVDDQVDVVTRGFLAMTVACARCHDHKFDPITQKDYYALAGIFFSSHILPGPGKKTDGSPMLRVPLIPPDEVAAIKAQSNPAKLEAELKKKIEAAYAEFVQNNLQHSARYLLAGFDYLDQPAQAALKEDEFATQHKLAPHALRGWVQKLSRLLPLASLPKFVAAPHKLLETKISPVAGRPGISTLRGSAENPSITANATDADVPITTLVLPARSVSIHPGQKSSVAVCWRSPINGRVRLTGSMRDSDNKCGDGIEWAAVLNASTGRREIFRGAIPNGGEQKIGGGVGDGAFDNVEVKAGDFVEFTIFPKKEYTCDTTTVMLNIEQLDSANVWNLARDCASELLKSNPHADSLGNERVWHFVEVEQASLEGARVPVMSAALDSFIRLAVAGSKNIERAPLEQSATDFQKELLEAAKGGALHDEFVGARSPFLMTERDEKILPAERSAELSKLRAEIKSLKSKPAMTIPIAIAAQEGGVPGSIHAGFKDARLHIRGSYTKLGDAVPRRVPEVFSEATPALVIKEGSGRLQLAQWIASPSHPLTARVMVNRVWQQHFGEGIIRTAGNFGKLGEAPTHPELLDFLAEKFVASGWSIKALHRMMMLSAVYQQSSVPSESALKLDAGNKLFSRMNRRRVECEVLRDSTLMAAGKLDTRMGGPSERDPLSPRRMLYLMSIRSDRSSFGPLFDAADPAAQIDRRTISIIAPQSLYLMNNNFMQTQADAFAARVIAISKQDPERISRAYEILFSRMPTADETRVGSEFLAASSARAGSMEAAWREYARVLLCSNEFVFVD